ncbi:hypothetical protein DPMN_146701 [Dreissena polymorpha]|uniref:Uncharacterized protein n=1 Tax=Dreissena polymorpha TaxID=45954 RepID=A0A9D4FAU2_DREPO|nr:hypothetical protein DPMN_146701 [Dreissena polymorpha]
MWNALMEHGSIWSASALMPTTYQKHGTAALNACPFFQNSTHAHAQRTRAWLSAATVSAPGEAGSTLGVSV